MLTLHPVIRAREARRTGHRHLRELLLVGPMDGLIQIGGAVTTTEAVTVLKGIIPVTTLARHRRMITVSLEPVIQLIRTIPSVRSNPIIVIT